MSAKTNAIKASLALFSPTFNRLPHIQSTTQNLKQAIYGRFDTYTLDLFSRTLYLGKIANEQVAQLQDQTTLQTISHFDRNYDTFAFDYKNGMFNFTKRLEADHIEEPKIFSIRINSIDVENFDHPFKRQTLYFHELKDMQKYGEFKVKQGVPKFIKKMQKRRVQNELLDQKNPWGIPKWAKPLKIKIEVVQNETMCGFDLQYHLGQIKLLNCSNTKKEYCHKLDPMVMDIKTQQMVFMFLKKKGGITHQQVEQMSKLAYIGGRVKKVELMMNLIEQLTHAITI